MFVYIDNKKKEKENKKRKKKWTLPYMLRRLIVRSFSQKSALPISPLFEADLLHELSEENVEIYKSAHSFAMNEVSTMKEK